MIKLVVLDRDGVINEDSPDYIKTPEAWRAIPGSLEAIAKLNNHGYKVAVATNQSGIARGYYSLETLRDIHNKMLIEAQKAGGKIDHIFICPHKPEDNCDCRKPKSGLLLQAADKFNVDPSEMIMIGDATRDILAAKNCGAKSIFVKTGYKKDDLIEAEKNDLPIFSNLARASDYLCSKT